MKQTLRYVVACAVILQVWMGAAPVRAQETEGLGPALERLAVTVDKMITLLEREAAARVEEREDRRVEVAAGIPSLMTGYNLEDVSQGIDEDCVYVEPEEE